MVNQEQTYLPGQSGEQYQFLLSLLNHPIFIENADRKAEFVNPAFCALLGPDFSPDKLLGADAKTLHMLMGMQCKHQESYTNAVNDTVLSGKAETGVPTELKNGRFLHRDYFPYFSGEQLRAHIWIYQDVTPLHQGADSLKHERTQFMQVLSVIPADIAIFSPDHRYEFVNQSAVQDPGIRSWIIGKNDLEYCAYRGKPKELAEQRAQYFQQALTRKEVVSWEEVLRDAKGGEHYYERTFYPLLSETEEVASVLMFGLNITVRKQQEQQLAIAHQRYLKTLDNLNEAVLMADGELKTYFINDAWRGSFGKTLEQARNGIIFDLIALGNYEFYRQVFSVLSGFTENVQGRIDIKDKAGRKRWFKYKISPGMREGEQKGILATLNDITEQVHMEENLLEVVKKQKELNDLKSAFVNMVSHELRTPLAVISSGAEIMQMMLQAGRPKEDMEVYTQQIINEVEKMTAFMNDLLMVSKIEAGKIDFRPERVSLEQFIKELAAERYMPWKDGRQLSIQSKGLLREIGIDKKMFRHALQNVVENAFKYSSGKPAPRLHIRYSNTYCTISVADNGIGILSSDIKELFTSFTRGKNTGNIPGTGIGLVVVKYFIEQHGGFVAVKSKANEGAVFMIKIPYLPA